MNLREHYGGEAICGLLRLFFIGGMNFMAKPFQTHNQQLKMLRNRNILISNGSKAKAILIRENYYQLINGYKHIFLDLVESKKRQDDYYKNGTTFEQIYALYEFDRNLRNILMKYILMTENSIKSKIAYQFSSEHPKEAFSYFNINNYRDTDHQKTTSLIAELSSVTKKNTDSLTKSGPFYHYFNEHKELPLWVLITKLTLGQTCSLLYNLKESTQIEILKAVLYEFKNNSNIAASKIIHQNYLKDFMSAINCIKAFRNVCAHEDRLYDYYAKNKNGRPIQTSFFYISIATPAFQGGIFDIILLLRLFLTKRDYKQLLRRLFDELNNLETALPSSLFSEVTRKMKLPKNWTSELNKFI